MAGKPGPTRSARSSPKASPRKWENLEQLLDADGDISLGRVSGTRLVAITASDGDQCLAMLQRRKGETLVAMLDRLDTAIAAAWDNDDVIDEINP